MKLTQIVVSVVVVVVALLVVEEVRMHKVRSDLVDARDSLRLVHEEMVQQQLAREARDDSLTAENAKKDSVIREAQSRIAAYVRADRRGLNRALVAVPETVQVVVREALATADSTIANCVAGLDACEAKAANLDLMIMARDSTIFEKDALLHSYSGQLDRAIRASRTSPLDWAARAGAVGLLVVLVTSLF